MFQSLVYYACFFFFSINLYASDRDSLHRYYKVLPESESIFSFGETSQAEIKNESVRTLIWNIKKTSMPNWQLEFMKLGRGNDLILVQEAYRNELFQFTLNFFNGFGWNLGASFLYLKDNENPTGTMIGAKVIPSLVVVKHSPDKEPLTGTPKAITFVKYPIQNKFQELLVVSVHAINFQTTEAFKRQMDQAAGIIKDHVGPVLFAGDFNTWNKARTTYLFNLIQKLGLSSVKFENDTDRLKFGKFYLDHSFVRSIAIKKAQVIKSNGSDHQPLLMEFDIL